MFTWGTTRDGDLGGRMPFWYGYFVREQIRHERRHNAAAQALLHKRSGMARTQIAKTMGRSVESVKELLQDAVFYEAPEDHPERLALARRCITLRNTHLNKEAVMKELQVTRGKALRAFRDAAFLESQRH
ncbi:hypothetical protein [Streptomyces sp. NPDC002088]|uniref:hypothetical protein n=1 Tax=Streptomyces sp. NPDC002088 TaxID=3154665 RepID=UPI003329BCD2